MQRYLFIITMILAGYGASAQSYEIRGSVTDTLNNYQMPYAAVTLLHRADSVLETFTRTAEDGSFSLHPSAAGKYIIMISYPSFVDFVDVIDVTAGQPADMGIIPMLSRTQLMEEFVLTQQIAAIKVKGDTIEYMADSFATRDNATVESLLKKLPGIQVDRNGQIIAQGEKVEKILVDGEEFFSDDPAVVTKSLQANAVERVQVFDKKSEQAEFTGIDDGEKTKTINLQLKENRKKGYFGKVEAGGGAGEERGYYENQLMLNAFKGKRKLSGFGIISNTGKIGLGWEDRDKFSGGNQTSYSDGIMYTYSTDDDGDFDSWSGEYNGQGLPRAATGGLHYSNKWNEDKHHIAGNYRYYNQMVETIGNTLTEYNLPNNTKNYTEENRNLSKTGERNKLSGLYEWKPDTATSVQLTVNGSYTNTGNLSVYNTKTFTDTEILNTSNRKINSNTISRAFNSTLDWRRKFQKKGRTMSLNVSQEYHESESDGYLNAVNTFSNAATTIVDQHKDNDDKSLSVSSKLSYTEPLSDKTFLEGNYSLKIDNNDASRITYNKSGTAQEAYDVIDPTFSNSYAFDVLTHAGGLNFRYAHNEINFSAGGSVSRASFTQRDLFADTSVDYGFTNFFPAANFTYKFNKQSRFNIRYNGNTTQPTLTQLQPLRDNTDPLNISIGNPYLTQEFNHNFFAQYNTYRVLTGQYIWTNGGISFVSNDISMSQQVDAQGRKTYQYINVDGNYNAWGYFGYGFKVMKVAHAGFNVQFNTNHVNNFINGIRNVSNNNSYTLGLDFAYESKDEKFSISLEPSATYYDNKSAVNTLTTSYWSMKHNLEVSYELPLKLEVGTDVEWYVREQTSVFDQNNNVFLWDAYVSKKILKNDQLELRATAHDILNQNLGFNRYAQNNYIYQESYNTIRRYGLVSLIWNFTKNTGEQPGNTNN